ncbi:hypothetical protein [Streptomyces sp. G45]|uniref:hypothetical protein n=1 Tax=Streptomyces sp. G45 TaxID=3406627 RepID=UPI003C1699E3
MRVALRAPGVLLLCLLLPVAACSGDRGPAQEQGNENGDNIACMGHHNKCVVVPPPVTTTAPTATPTSASPSATGPSPSDTPTPTPMPSDSGGDGASGGTKDDDGDDRGDESAAGGGGGGAAPDGSGVSALLERAPRAVLHGPGAALLRVAVLDVPRPQPRWSTLGIGARQLRAAGVGGVLFRLPTPVPASVSVDTAEAPADVEYVFFDGGQRRLGTMTAAGCAVLCPSLTQNVVAAPQYQHLLVTAAGRSAGWPLGQRYSAADAD